MQLKVAGLGGLSIAVGNAGMLHRCPALEIDDAAFARVLAVNLHGGFAVAQEAARAMVAAGAGGRIVLVTSVNQAHVGAGIAHYAASKAGLMMLGRGMAVELAAHGITVNMVAPGTIETDLNRHELADGAYRASKLALVPAGRAGTPEDVAGAVVYLASVGAGYVTGSTVVVDGGLTVG